MTWIDLFGILLIFAYGVGGFFTGVVRRLIGFIALYVALLAATNMGLQAGAILQQTSNFEVPDGRIYGFFGIVVAVLVIVEGATQLAHAQIQIPALALNRSLGVIVGVITGVFLTVACVYELGAAANPFGGSSLDPLQQKIRDGYNGSHVIVPFVKAIDKPIINLFDPALPSDPQIYFGPSPVNP
ncbi:MAG TPA: CvpA family protein [Candidatus Dormibacteraeota bacterium]|nr:CvpA family protein [Candidatus Dormibacteraeota bacterium]